MNILCIGDVVGRPGRNTLKALLPGLKEEYNIDFIIVNAENAAGGTGLTQKTAKELIDYGCDVLTLGDHVWDQKDLEEYLKETDVVLKPANFPSETPGKGICIKELTNGTKVAVVNLLGRVFIRYNVDCPFRKLQDVLREIKKETPIIIIDFHAEATSEKIAMGHFADGKVSAVVGTHTHVQTADEKILEGKTAYITDLGMTGPQDSVIGQEKENIINRFLTSMPLKFNIAKGTVQLNGAIIEIDENTGKAINITRVQREYEDINNK